MVHLEVGLGSQQGEGLDNLQEVELDILLGVGLDNLQEAGPGSRQGVELQAVDMRVEDTVCVKITNMKSLSKINKINNNTFFTIIR